MIYVETLRMVSAQSTLKNLPKIFSGRKTLQSKTHTHTCTHTIICFVFYKMSTCLCVCMYIDMHMTYINIRTEGLLHNIVDNFGNGWRVIVKLSLFTFSMYCFK